MSVRGGGGDNISEVRRNSKRRLRESFPVGLVAKGGEKIEHFIPILGSGLKSVKLGADDLPGQLVPKNVQRVICWS